MADVPKFKTDDLEQTAYKVAVGISTATIEQKKLERLLDERREKTSRIAKSLSEQLNQLRDRAASLGDSAKQLSQNTKTANDLDAQVRGMIAELQRLNQFEEVQRVLRRRNELDALKSTLDAIQTELTN